jgi:RHS repeat-associated protein
MLAQVALIHMNGRIYDPAIGRMMSADPFVQDPTNGQSLNRYAYVINNPLAYTDPNGFFFKSIFRAIGNIISNPKAIIAIAAAIAVPELGIFNSAILNGALGGAIAGGITGGDFKSVVTGSISGAIFAGVGDEISRVAKEAAKQGSKVVAYTALEKAAFHAAAGGVTSIIQGGDFKSGFLAAGFAKLAGPIIPDIGGIGNTIARATMGGIAAVVAGGRFGNGATTAAFANLFNDILHVSAQIRIPRPVSTVYEW